MGVDVSMGPITNLDNKILDEVCPDDEDATLLGKKEPSMYSRTGKEAFSRKKSIDIMQESVESDKLVESVSEKDTKKEHIEDFEGDHNNDMILRKKREEEINSVVKRRPKKQNKSNENVLPPGWEKHSDENGYYYWHVKSGTIQRDYPHSSMGSAMLGEEEKRELVRDVRSSIIYDDEFDANHLETALTSPQPTSKTTNPEPTHSSFIDTKDSSQTQNQVQNTSSTSMNSSNISSASTSSGLSKSCTSSSIMDLGKEKETQKRRSLPPCKENDESGTSNVSSSGVRPMQV